MICSRLDVWQNFTITKLNKDKKYLRDNSTFDLSLDNSQLIK